MPQIKRWTRAKKEALMASCPFALKHLSKCHSLHGRPCPLHSGRFLSDPSGRICGLVPTGLSPGRSEAKMPGVGSIARACRKRAPSARRLLAMPVRRRQSLSYLQDCLKSTLVWQHKGLTNAGRADRPKANPPLWLNSPVVGLRSQPNGNTIRSYKRESHKSFSYRSYRTLQPLPQVA